MTNGKFVRVISIPDGPFSRGRWWRRFSVDENVIFSEKVARRLTKFSLTAQNHKATRPVKEWLGVFDFRPVLTHWMDVNIPNPPVGSVEKFRANVQFMLDHYNELDY